MGGQLQQRCRNEIDHAVDASLSAMFYNTTKIVQALYKA
jgi:hypothetical protein